MVNPALLSVLINVIMSKTQVHDVSEIDACLDLSSKWMEIYVEWFNAMNKSRHPQSPSVSLLPPSFDFHFLKTVIDRLLDSEHNQILLKTFEFLHVQWDLFSEIQCDIFRYLLIKKKRMYKFFLHWSQIVREFYQILLLYRVLRPRKWWKYMPPSNDHTSSDVVVDLIHLASKLYACIFIKYYIVYENKSHADLLKYGVHVYISGKELVFIF